MHPGTIESTVGAIEVRTGGAAGPTLVYLHSAQGEGEGLELLDRLAERFQVVAPMFPGFGASHGIELIDDMEDATFHLLDLFDRLGLDQPVVVGVSLGGWMAAELATRYPERVSRLVLVNAAGLYIEGAPIKDIFGRGAAEMAPDLYVDQDHPMAQLMRQVGSLAGDWTAELPFEAAKPYLQSIAATARIAWDPYLHNPRLRRRLGRIIAPTLVVRAVGDTLIPQEHARAYAAEIPGACYVELEGAAHMAMIEQPAALAAVITEFVA